MLILPVINNHKVMNIEVKLKDVSKIRTNFYSNTIKENDIIVNRAKYSESSYKESKEESAMVDFIRNRSILYPRRFHVTTKSRVNSNTYDVYEVPQPPRKINNNLDKMYSKALLDLMNEIPGKDHRGKYISFKDFGLDTIISDDNIIALQRIVMEEKDIAKRFELLQENDLFLLEETLRTVQSFEYTLLSECSIPEKSLDDCLKVFGVLHTRDYKNLNKYYRMALDNTNTYTRLSYIHKLLYNKPLSLIQRKNIDKKQLVKRIEEVDLLSQKRVLILGCGGVGGYVAEALARSNIGTLILIDYDVVDESNINRQIIALSSTIGMKKVEVLKNRVLDINPTCHVITIDSFISSEEIDSLFQYEFDYLIDACDTVSTKMAVIKDCLEKKIPFISSMGTGNKLDPSMLEVVDIRKTVNDPLARVLRKFVKDLKINQKVMVLSSRELPIKNHDRIPGSTAFVPSSAGLLIASYVVRQFISKVDI